MATVSINHRTDPRTLRAAAKARPRQGLPRAPVSYPAMILDLMLSSDSSDATSKIINQASVPIPRHFATWFRASPFAQLDRVGKKPLARA